MRVIAGKFKRKNLETLPGSDVTRPTSDRVKESIFNILQDRIQDAMVLDLFSGSGALGIECLSKGCQFVQFVEQNKSACVFIKKNTDNLQSDIKNWSINCSSVDSFIKKNSLDIKFNLVFADPPYDSLWYKDSLAQLEQSGLCADDCLLILEMSLEKSQKVVIDENLSRIWEMIDDRKFGHTYVQFWKRKKV